MSLRIEFAVQGSAAEPYVVTFERVGMDLKATCTCPAGALGQYCKHRFSILAGEDPGIVRGDPNQIAIVAQWLPESDVEAALVSLAEAEERLATAKREVSAAKKAVARAMQ